MRADAATLFCADVDFGLLRIFDALDATDGDVFSFLAIVVLSVIWCGIASELPETMQRSFA